MTERGGIAPLAEGICAISSRMRARTVDAYCDCRGPVALVGRERSCIPCGTVTLREGVTMRISSSSAGDNRSITGSGRSQVKKDHDNLQHYDSETKPQMRSR